MSYVFTTFNSESLEGVLMWKYRLVEIIIRLDSCWLEISKTSWKIITHSPVPIIFVISKQVSERASERARSYVRTLLK